VTAAGIKIFALWNLTHILTSLDSRPVARPWT